MTKDKELMAIVFHFILSVVIIGCYLGTVILDKPDLMLQSAALVVVGYWFGAVGVPKLTAKKRDDTLKKDGD